MISNYLWLYTLKNDILISDKGESLAFSIHSYFLYYSFKSIIIFLLMMTCYYLNKLWIVFNNNMISTNSEHLEKMNFAFLFLSFNYFILICVFLYSWCAYYIFFNITCSISFFFHQEHFNLTFQLFFTPKNLTDSVTLIVNVKISH